MATKEQIQTDKFSQYLSFRADYVEKLKQHDLLDASGSVRPEIIAGLSGDGTKLVEPGSALDEYCREHPEDKLCWVVDVGSRVEEFLDIRGEFLDRIRQNDLHEIQDFVVGLRETVEAGSTQGPRPPRPTNQFRMGSMGSVGLVTPDQDLDDIPRWLWPYVNPAVFEGLRMGGMRAGGIRMGGRGGGSVGKIGPDQDLDDFPVPLWPYIRPADAMSFAGSGRLSSSMQRFDAASLLY